MKVIRKRRIGYTLLLIAGLCLTLWLGTTHILQVAVTFGIISVFSLVLLIRQSRLLHAARLIWDNRILAVPSALSSDSGCQVKKDTEETVVSTFGILIGSVVYCWGVDGVHGVRLHAVQIDNERLHLTFGDSAQTMHVELLHGLTHKQAVLDTAQKLLYETGVTADINGW